MWMNYRPIPEIAAALGLAPETVRVYASKMRLPKRPLDSRSRRARAMRAAQLRAAGLTLEQIRLRLGYSTIVTVCRAIGNFRRGDSRGRKP